MGKGLAGWLIFALALGLAFDTAQASPTDCAARAATWDGTQSRCVLRISTPTYTESVQVPTGLDRPLQQAAEETLAAVRAKFERDAARATQDQPFSLHETYQQIPGPNGVANLVMTIFAEVGAYHPVMGYRTLVFKGDRRIGLADLFQDGAAALGVLYPMVKADLERQRLVGQSGELADLIEQDIVQGTGTDPEHYQYFVLAQDELRFLFLPYQVADYASGPQVGHLPLSQIQGVLAPGLI